MNPTPPFSTSEGLWGPVYFVMGLINMVVPVLVAAALIFFMIGVIRYIYDEGEKTRRGLMLWSLVALFVMVSMWGTLRLMCLTFTQSSTCGGTTVNSTY